MKPPQDMTPEELRSAVAELCGGEVYETLGIRYKDGMESWGNSKDYTAQKCANYQRQGLGCKLIKRKYCDTEYEESLDAMAEAEGMLTHPMDRVNYINNLRAIVSAEVPTRKASDLDCVLATARQRAIAFVQTMRKK